MMRHGAAMSASNHLTFLVLLLASGRAMSQLNASMPLYQVHGSGTSNPALLIWRVMDIMMAGTKPKVAMSYRSIGSGAGGAEFSNYTSSAFGCGDVPINSANFSATAAQGNPMMHIPFLVGSVSIFHNIPGIGQGLILPPCTLAKIFRGDISSWNHSEILGANPHLAVDMVGVTASITVVHRNDGSSSTYALTHYLNKTCPEYWGAYSINGGTGPGPAQNRRVGVTSDWPADAPGRWVTGINSQDIVEKIAGNAYALGYVESGQGLGAGLQEVAIRNVNGLNLTSSAAVIAPDAFISAQFPANLTSDAWIAVNPIYASSSAPNQWPLTLGSYFYVRTNLSYLNESGGLLKLFLMYMLSDDVAGFLSDYSFTPLPKQTRADLVAQLNATLTVAPTPSWLMESGTQVISGQRDFVFSPKARSSYLVNTVTGLVTDNRDTKITLKMGDAYQVHGSGSFVSALFLRHAMALLEGRARVPISMTYRSVGSVEAQAELADFANMYQSYNHFKVGDMPLDSTIWGSLNSATNLSVIGAVLQLPFAASALAIYHTKAVGRPALRLDCQRLADIYTGQISSWSDASLINFNAGISTSADQAFTANITVFAMAAPSAATYALTGYLSAACNSTWARPGPVVNVTNWPANVNTSFRGVPITTPEQMLAALAATPNAIGYLPASLGASSGLMEVQMVVPGAPSPLTSGSANMSAAVQQFLDANPGIFSNLTSDLAAAISSSKSSLYGMNKMWPMPMVQYLYMFQNLSGYGYSGPLLRAFVEFLVPGTLDGEGSQLAVNSSLAPMPVSVQSAVRQALSRVTLKTLTVVWDTESAGLSDGSTGAALYTFSANREAYDVYQLSQLQDGLAQVQARLDNQLPPLVRLACSPDAFGYVRLLRTDVQDMATRPIRILDEMATPDATVQMLQAALTGSNTAAPTHMILHPGPLSQASWETLSRVAPVAQIPASIRPVGLLYQGEPGLRLTLCTLARILAGNITTWNDAAILADNPGYPTPPGQPIRVLAASANTGDVQAVLAYIQKGSAGAGCPEYSNLALPSSVVVNSSGVTTLGGNYTGLALLAASNLVSEWAAGAALQAVALPSVISGAFVTPLQTTVCTAATGVGGSSTCVMTGSPAVVAAAYTTAVDSSISSFGGMPASDPTGPWSGFVLAPLSGADVYPVVRFDFLVVPADLNRFGADGAALLGLIKYASRTTFMDRLQQALGPFFSALSDRVVRNYAVWARNAVASDGLSWTVVDSSNEVATDPFRTIVAARAPMLSDLALEGSAAAAASSSSGSNNAGSDEIYSLLRQLQSEHDKLNLTYGIAVAALVLGLVLSLLALGLAAVMALRRGAEYRSSSSPPEGKYEVMRGVAGSNVQMGATV